MSSTFIRPQAWLLLALATALHEPAQAATERWQLVPGSAEDRQLVKALTEHWQLADKKQFFLQDPPNSFTGLYRSQGIATDGQQWFFSWQYGLEIANDDFKSIQRNSSFQLPMNLVPGIPLTLLKQGLDHIGDIDYYNGIIYAPLDTTKGYTNGHVALYNASDLSYTGIVYELTGAPSNPKKDIASWVAVDAKRNLGYGKEWQSGNTINVYNLEDWSFDHTLTLDMALESIQGAKVHGDWLYMASDNATQSVYRANLLNGHVEELFRLPTPAGDREVEGIALRDAPDGGVDMYVEMIVDPDRSGQDLSNAHMNVTLYHYKLTRVPAPPLLKKLRK